MVVQNQKNNKMIKGISVLNPVEIDREYFLFTIDYAIKNRYDHIQLIGPIHDSVKGNIDGMIWNRKYSQFNSTKDSGYVDKCLSVVNEGLEKASKAGIKTYFWHHELDLPLGFNAAFPETLNENGDIEVTNPIVKDYLENRLYDFFDDYPKMNGVILTLHETKVPLLKLKNQKLDAVGRVQYVTKILYETCKRLEKELIVRPFASVEEDYAMMVKAYEQISTSLIIMDKWTQFDWSLTLPSNKFYNKIKNNPLLVEGDIFGEYFGKGRLPLMLKKHIVEKVEYCKQFNPIGYCSRIDRNCKHPFGDINEVNLVIMHAAINGFDVDVAIKKFMFEKYGTLGEKIKEIMEKTENILRKIIYLQGYYFSELSLFPTLNHSKNHFYFEMMKDNYQIVSNEWFVPENWIRGDIEKVLEEKENAKNEASLLKVQILSFKDKMDEDEFEKLSIKFINLEFVAKIWYELTKVYMHYVRYFKDFDEYHEQKLYESLKNLSELNIEGKQVLGDKFYCVNGDDFSSGFNRIELIDNFIAETKESFEYEKKVTKRMLTEGLTDFVVCGGANEGHEIKKEVNFSDTLILNGELVRIPGNRKGMEWSTINAHGWFSYKININENKENKIIIAASNKQNLIDMKITIANDEYIIKEKAEGKNEYAFVYNAGAENSVRVRIDRISNNTPCVYFIKVK